jgi:lysyl-tRNA synthetase class 2
MKPLSLTELLALRHRALQAVRGYFISRDYLEIETPIRVRKPALEPHIDAEPSGEAFLRTSPELHMKRLLAAGARRIFQVGPCFRRGERGSRHRPEYTMLEWYCADTDYRGVLEETRGLLQAVAEGATGSCRLPAREGGAPLDVAAPWHVLSVREAFGRFAGWDPVAAYDADRFDLDLVQRVEPALPTDRPVVLIDYPREAAALARCRTDSGGATVAERWELYAGGLELANAYSELTDPVEQRRRFEACARLRREDGRDVYAIDEEFLAALADMPPCGGVALGVDRLIMLLAGADTIDAVCPFNESR